MIVRSLTEDYLALGYSLAIGAILGLLWDAARVLRLLLILPVRPELVRLGRKNSQKSHSKISDITVSAAAFIADILFFVAAALILSVFVFHASTGRVRGFLIAGVTVGFAGYMATLERLTKRGSYLAVGALEWLVRLLARLTNRLVFRPIYVMMSKTYELTLGRILRAVSRRRAERLRLRSRAALRALCEALENTEFYYEINSDEHPREAHDTARVRVSDNHLRQRRDTLQRPRRGAR